MNATNLIYGLIDPRTLLIRYVGLSSRGMRRPKEHRRSSGPNTYRRNWVQSLKRLGLTYEIVVLEVIKNEAELSQAERWWIAFGRACGWPLTNLTAGGGPSESALAEIRRKSAARAVARDVQLRQLLGQCHQVAERIDHPEEVRCFGLFERHVGSSRLLIDVVIEARVASDTVRRLYKKWLQLSQQRGKRALMEERERLRQRFDDARDRNKT
jgi:hypothetical protein